MSEDAPAAYLLAVAVLFARIGGMFLIAPGLSNMRAPVKVRLFLALGVTLALSPPLIGDATLAIAERTPGDLLRVIGSETAVGFFIGLLARLMLMALQFISVAIANVIGLGGIPGLSIDGDEPAQAAAALFMVTAITIIIVTDLHHEIIRAAVGSYEVIPVGGGLDTRDAIAELAVRAGQAFLVALRVGAPFIIYGIIVNFAVGLTNKLTPQVPVFFVALPAITAGGLLMMAYAIREVMFAFRLAFDQLMISL